MSNSNLISYTLISPNKSKRTAKIDTITIHCFVGQVSVKRGCEVFQSPKKQASCNYVVAFDGQIGLVCPEEFRSWCSSNQKNDDRAITIEVACDSLSPYKVKDAAMDSLVKLCADICRRNGIKSLVWSKNKTDRVNHKNGVNMTCHRDYANKSCPGQYIYDREGSIAEKVNNLLNYPAATDKGLGVRTSAIGSINFNDLDYSSVLDWKYYRNKYADLGQNGLRSQSDFVNHFKIYGMVEAREGIYNFNPIKYRNNNPDLSELFGDDWPWYYAHYILAGKKEGRKGC